VTTPASTTPLPDLKLPLLPWLLAPAFACGVVGAIGFGIAHALSAQEPIAALYGGASTAVGVLIASMAILPWIPRPLNHWGNLLLGGQLLAFMLTIGAGVVAWKGTGVEPTPLGLTGAAAFLVSMLVQASVFHSVARPIELELQRASSKTDS